MAAQTKNTRRSKAPSRSIPAVPPITAATEKCITVDGVSLDVPTIKALQASEARYRTLFDCAQDAILILEDGRLVECNDRTLSMFGCTDKADLLGRSAWDFSPEYQPDGHSSKELTAMYLRKARDGVLHNTFPWRHLRKDGTFIDTEVTLSQFKVGDKHMLFSIIRDVTERKNDERIIAESEERYRVLIDNLPVVIWRADLHGVIRFISKNVKDIYGFTQEEICDAGQELWLERMHADDQEKAMRNFALSVQTGLPFDIEFRIRNKKEELVWFRAISTGMVIVDEARYVSGIFYDVTKEKQVQSVKDEQLQLEQLMFKISSHFLNVPLHAIDSEIHKSLQWLLAFFDFDRITIIEYAGDGAMLKLAYTTGSLDERIAKIDINELGWLKKQIAQGREIILCDVQSELPREARAERELMRTYNIVSNVCIPLRFSNAIMGFMEFHTIGRKKVIAEALLPRMRLLGEMFANILVRKKVEAMLEDSQRSVRAQKEELEKKNIALHELLKQIESEKEMTKKDIQENLDAIIFPMMKHLKLEGSAGKNIAVLEQSLHDIVSSFGYKLAHSDQKLSPKEVHVCNMIRSGLATKEIASLLRLSKQTVEKHRKNIRKKLAIANKGINLTSYLQSM